jgi:hypothetical protein
LKNRANKKTIWEFQRIFPDISNFIVFDDKFLFDVLFMVSQLDEVFCRFLGIFGGFSGGKVD